MLFKNTFLYYNQIVYCLREQETESCSRFVHSMDGAVKNLMATSLDQTKKHQGPYKREYQKIGQAFYALGQAFGMEEATGKLKFHAFLVIYFV